MGTFQVSDLAKKRTAVIEAARTDCAVIRDKDQDLVMLEKSKLTNLEKYQYWSMRLERLRGILSSGNRPSAVEWSDLAWLRVFDNNDLNAFCEDLANELIINASENDYTGLDCLIREWRARAGQLEDPLRKHVLLSSELEEADFIEAKEPSAGVNNGSV